ncbi:pheromone processing endoprotease [Mucor velutinosus]|uniref:Exonuclease 1 n=1 Tax=Mucor velutinosus TaxID=708070 RepID=A0AAN7D3Z1_9FUNG|nr:pheromone processing endoprotease [Mucor velutinosus]
MTSIGVLLQSIDRNQRTIKFSEYKGKTVAIDGDYFLLDGASRTALEPVWNHSANSYNDYLLEFTQLLEENGVTPIVVFGGLPLSFKQSMNNECRKARQAALNSGSHLGPVTISEDMAIATITKLMEKKIKCIVAPCETSAQLTYLAKTGKVDAVVSEDPELLAFGCPKFIHKSFISGEYIEFCMDRAFNDNRSNFRAYGADTFRHICILSLAGCNYLLNAESAIFRALLRVYEGNNSSTDQVLRVLQKLFKEKLLLDYLKNFHMTDLGFTYQWVYDMDKKNYVRLNPLPPNCSEEDVKLLGKTPTVQDSIKFIVNEIAPKSKPLNLKERITEKFLAYAKSVKENIMPSHLGTPFSAAAPKSQKSPKSSTSSASRMGPKRVLSELSNVTTVSVSVATTAGEFFASTSAQASSHLPRPTVATPKESTAACPSFSLPPSVEQPLMPLTEASTTSTHDDPISPPHVTPTKDEMPDTTTVSINNINASVSKVSQDTNQTSSGQTCERNNPSPPLSPPTATPIKENTASYNQHTGAKPLADKSAQPVKITPPPSHYIPNIAHINPSTNNIATSIKQTAIPTQQDTLARPNASELSQAVNMTPSSDHVSYNAHVNFSTSNTTIAATITAIKLSQNASNGGGEENGNNNSSKYDMRDPYYNNPNYFIPTNMASRSNNEKSKKRSFDQTEHSVSTMQGNSRKKHHPR